MSFPQSKIPEGFEELSITPSLLDQEAKKFGLTKSSGHRTPLHNKKVGGVDNSDHLTGQAGDYVGARQKEFYNYLRKNYGVKAIDEGDHIHAVAKGVPEGFEEVSSTTPTKIKPTPTKTVDDSALKFLQQLKRESSIPTKPRPKLDISNVSSVTGKKLLSPNTPKDIPSNYIDGVLERLGISEETPKLIKNTLDAILTPTKLIYGDDQHRINPVETIPGALISAQISPLQTAEKLRREKGLSYLDSLTDPEILGHSGLALIPGIGPMASQFSTEVKEGDLKGASQTAIAMALPFLATKLKGAKDSGKIKDIKIENSKTNPVTTFDDSTKTIYINPIKLEQAIKEGRNPAALIDEGITHEIGHAIVDSSSPTEKLLLKESATKLLKPKEAEKFIKEIDKPGPINRESSSMYKAEEKVVEDITKTGEALRKEGLIEENIPEGFLEERNAGLNPISAIKAADDLNIPAGSSRAPIQGGSFEAGKPKLKGYTRSTGSPLSRAGIPGQYEQKGGFLGKKGSDIFREAQYNVQALENKWGKLQDNINSNLDTAFKEGSAISTATDKTLFPSKLRKLLGGKKTRDEFMKDWIDLVEQPFDDPSRQAIKSSNSPLGKALREHDSIANEWKQYTIDTQKYLGREIADPDNWGITDQGYYRHLFLGDIRLFKDGIQIDTAPTYAIAQQKALEIWKTNPTAKISALGRDLYGSDPTLRLSNKRFWGLLGKVRKSIFDESLVDISTEALREDMQGIVGRKAAQQKAFGGLFKREGYEGYSTDYAKVQQLHIKQLANSQEVSKLNHDLQPIIEKLNAAGKSGVAEAMQLHLDHVWGKPLPSELRFGEWIRKTPILRNTVANPDFALRTLAWKIGRVNNFLQLDYNIRSTTVNLFQPLTTLYPFVSSKQYAGYVADMLTPSTWKRLQDLDVLSGASKIETGASSSATPFNKASEFNRGMGYLHGEVDAARLGYTGVEAHRWAMDWAERVEFNNSKWNVAPALRHPVAKIVGQYKGYLLKDLENIRHTFRDTPTTQPKQPKLLRASKQVGARLGTGGLNTILRATPWVAGYKIIDAIADNLESMGIEKEKANELSEAVVYGSPSLIGLEMSGSFSLIDIFGNTPQEQFFNLVGGPTLGKGANIIKHISDDKPEKIPKVITPYVKFSNLIDAVKGDKTTTDLDANYKLQLSKYQAIMEALGFTLKEKSLYFDMKDAKVNPRTGEPSLRRSRRDKRLLKEVSR